MYELFFLTRDAFAHRCVDTYAEVPSKVKLEWYEPVHRFYYDGLETLDALETIFRTAQNLEEGWKPKTRSMMVGDLVKHEGNYYLCVSIGYRQVEVI